MELSGLRRITGLPARASPSLPPQARLLVVSAGPVTVAAVVAAGLAHHRFQTLKAPQWAVIVVMAAMVAASSSRPLLLFRGDESEAFTSSEAFLVVLLLDSPGIATVAAMTLASAVAQVVRRRPPAKAVFNVGQIALAAGAAAGASGAVATAGSHPAIRLLGAVIGAAVFFAVNSVAVASILVALGSTWRACLLDGIRLRLLLSGAGIFMGAAGGVAISAHPWALVLTVPALILLRFAVAFQFAAEHDRARVEALLDATMSSSRSLRREAVTDRVLRSARSLLRCSDVRFTYVDPGGGMSAPVSVIGEKQWLVATGRRRDEPFEASDRDFLEALAAVASAAITNAELYGQVRVERQRLASIALSIGEAVVACDLDGRITFANTAASRTVALPGVATIVDDHMHDDALLAPEFLLGPARRCVEERRVVRDDDAVFPGRNGRELPVSYVAAPVLQDGRAAGAVITFSDLSEVKEMEAQLRYRADHDSLTGLASRGRLLQRLEELLHEPPAEAGPALLVIDVDRFKAVNDSLGHATGDELLVAVAERLAAALPTPALLSRSGGDEYLALLERVAGVDDATAAARVLTAAIDHPLALPGGYELVPTVSVGVAMGGDGASADDVLHDAAVALQRAKGRGRGGVVEVFDRQSMGSRSAVLLHLEADLRQAVENDQIETRFLPRISLTGGAVVGAEAVPSWRHPHLGLIGPESFLPLAEACGLSVSIGRRVLEQAVAHLDRLDAAGHTGLPVTVPVTHRQFLEAGLVTDVRRILRDRGVAPGRLVLEITESMVIDGLDGGTDVLTGLRSAGVGLAVSEFGTGNSSLGYLKRLPVQEIKVDRSFVAGIAEDPLDRPIVRAVVELAGAIGAEPVADGIDTAAQADALRDAGCAIGQGAHLAGPLAPERFIELVAHQAAGETDRPMDAGLNT